MKTSKFEQIVQSRKVWASAIALLLLSLLFYFGAIEGETYAWGVTIAVSVFTGAVALEDGLSALFVGLAGELATTNFTNDTNEEETVEETTDYTDGEEQL